MILCSTQRDLIRIELMGLIDLEVNPDDTQAAESAVERVLDEIQDIVENA
jgi:hypothetical protein